MSASASRTAITIAACVALACLCALLLVSARFVFSLKEMIAYEAERTRQVLDRQMTQARLTAGGIALLGTARLSDEVRHVRMDTDRRIEAIQDDARLQIRDALERADSHVSAATGAILEVSADLRETLRQTRAMAASGTRLADDLRPQMIGLTAAAKITAGEMAQASRRIDSALPDALRTWQQIGHNSEATTAATARAMGNLADATRPLPRWLRYPLAVTGAIAPTAAGAVSAAAATGAFR